MMHLPLTGILALLGMLLLTGCRPVAPPSPTPHAEAVTISSTAGVTIIDVFSPRGIGAAQTPLTPDYATHSIQVRFHLTGLEQAVFDNGAAQLTVAVSSHPPFAIYQTLTADGVTLELASGDTSWSTVDLVTNSDTPPVIPLPAGYIAVTLPPGFVDAAQPTLALHWTDFYR